MAVALQRSGRVNAALPYAQRALVYRPQDPGRVYMVGYLTMNTEDFVAAQPYLEAAARAVPDNPVYLNSLGRCDFKLDRIPEARTAWHQAMRVAPRFAPAYLNCARMEWHVGNRDEARRLLTEYERLVPPAKRAPAAAVLIDSLVREGRIRPHSQ